MMYEWVMALLAGVAVPQALPTEAAAPAPVSVVIPLDTPVELMAMSEVSTASATPGTTIKLRVNRAVEIDGRVVIPVGTPAFGEVTAAKKSGGLGKTGSMAARLRHIRLGTTDIPIEGDLAVRGASAGSAGAAILLTGFTGLFHRGNNAKIKAGEIVAAFVSQDTAVPVDSVAATR